MKNLMKLQTYLLQNSDSELVGHLAFAREFNQWANGSDIPKNAAELNELGDFENDGDDEILQTYAEEEGETDKDILERSCQLHYLLKFFWLKSVAEEMAQDGYILKKEATLFTKQIKSNLVDRIINNYIYA